MLWRRVLPFLGMRLAPGPAQPVAWGMQTRRAILQAAGRLRYFLQCRRLRCSRVRVGVPCRRRQLPPGSCIATQLVKPCNAPCAGVAQREVLQSFWAIHVFSTIFRASMHRLPCSASPALAWYVILGKVHKRKLAGWVMLWADWMSCWRSPLEHHIHCVIRYLGFSHV